MLQWSYLKVVFAVPDRFEVETAPKVEPGESFNDVWRFYGNFVNPATLKAHVQHVSSCSFMKMLTPM